MHRLTTVDVHASIGLTPEELRDGLCLFHPGAAEMGGEPADDLLSLVETTLREIHKTVSGQFISVNKDNRQYFIDLKKTDDYDAIIEKRAEPLSDDILDRYYYDALRQVLECTDIPTHTTGYQIWQHELEWTERRAGRLGYLFFGAPNERSTAVPMRDFYLYFIQPFAPPRYSDEKKSDEVFFRLTGKDDAFTQSLKLYSASLELGGISSGVKKATYEKKAAEHLVVLTKWLRENLLNAVEVTYQGSRKKLVQWLKESGKGGLNIRDSVNAVGSKCFAEHFANLAPEYPRFSTLITYGRDSNAQQAAQEALRGVGQPNRTKQATAVLDALELLDGDKLDPAKSRYARYLIDALKAKGHGQVVNRQEVVTTLEPEIEFFVPDKFRLEPMWLSVLLGALVYSGDAVLTVPGAKFDATNLNALTATPVTELQNFKHIERPKDWNIPSLKALFELMDLPPGMAMQVTQGVDVPVQQLHKVITERVEKLVLARQHLLNGIPFWGQTLYTEAEIEQNSAVLTKTKEFLESLQAYNTPGKLKNFKYEAAEITGYRTTFAKLREIESLEGFAIDVSQLTQYLGMAETVLPEEHAWAAQSKATRAEILAGIRKPAQRESEALKTDVVKRLKALKAAYIKVYLDLYRRARLSLAQDKEKNALLQDYRLRNLRRLATIETINRQQLTEFDRQLGQLKTGTALSEKDLETEPKADFWPSMEDVSVSAETRLKNLKSELEKIYKTWTHALLNDLADPVIQSHFDLLKSGQKKLLGEFTAAKELPDDITQEFLAAIQQALSGLSKVQVRLDDLRDKLFPDGSPATLDELRKRFNEYIEQLLKGRDAGKIRLVLE